MLTPMGSPSDYCDGQFTCANGHCIPYMYVCDYYNNCGDNSDETIKACSKLYTVQMFM